MCKHRNPTPAAINAGTIHAAVLAAAALAPEYDERAAAVATYCDTARLASVYFLDQAHTIGGPGEQHVYMLEAARDAAASEYLEAQQLPPAFVTFQTSERGRHKVRNIRARLEAFAAQVKANQRAFGGGIQPAARAKPAQVWSAQAVKVIREALQERQYAEALQLAEEKAGARFYTYSGKAPVMFFAPVDVPELPGCISAMREDGRYVVMDAAAGLSIATTGGRASAVRDAIARVEAEGREKLAAAIARAAATPCDQAAARAAWLEAHGIEAEPIEPEEIARQAAEAEAPAPIEAEAAEQVAAMVADAEAAAGMVRAVVATAEALAAAQAPAALPAAVCAIGATSEAAGAPAMGHAAAMAGHAGAGSSGPSQAHQAPAGGAPWALVPAWCRYEPAGSWRAPQVDAMAPAEYAAAREALQAINHHSEALVLAALRAGHPGAVWCAREALRLHQAAGYLTPEADQLQRQAREALRPAEAPAQGIPPADQDEPAAEASATPAASAQTVQDLDTPAPSAETVQDLEPATEEEPAEPIGTGTYSPEDNKLRLYPFARLDAATYARVKAAGFAWAPKQELFVAPAWSPARADLLAQLCGEIEDEDRSLMDRAAERSERFEDYQEARTRDAAAAHAQVHAIGARFEAGQPILVGHHSERKARKDKERMDAGMRRAVQMWDTAEYWQQRAGAAVRHASYKERPDVRARRIKGLEAEARKVQRNQEEAALWLKLWTREGLTIEQARAIANRCWLNVAHVDGLHWTAYDVLCAEEDGRNRLAPVMTLAQVVEIARRRYTATLASCARWAAHYAHRIAYERAMLGEAGGTAADKTGPQVGGACRCWASPRGGWSLIRKVNKVSVTLLDNWGNGGRDFTRTIPFDKLHALMTRAEVDQAREAGRLIDETARGFYLAPARAPEGIEPAAPIEPAAEADTTPAPSAQAPQDLEPAGLDVPAAQGIAPAATLEPAAEAADAPAPSVQTLQDLDRGAFEAMRAALRAGGAQVVTAPQLFPTPQALAWRMVHLAQLTEGAQVLEPSAGTGNILREILRGRSVQLQAVEINASLCRQLAAAFPAAAVTCADFLEWQAPAGGFDAVLMNPPFAGAADIAHIRHALGMLKPGGRLVAICAGGPRQAEQLQPLVEEHGGLWQPLPADTFKESGTAVRTVLLCITTPAAPAPEGIRPADQAEPAAEGIAPSAQVLQDLGAREPSAQTVQDLGRPARRPRAKPAPKPGGTVARWEGDVIRHVEALASATHSDAAGLVQAQWFRLLQEWAKGTSAEAAAAIVAGSTAGAPA